METKQLQLFNFNNQTITIIDDDKQNPHFLGSQIAKILDFVRPNNAVAMHVDDDEKISFGDYKKKYPNTKIKLLDSTMLINESGLYALIFGSKLEKAKEFRKYVTSVVLPSIRKNGTFTINKPTNNQIVLMNEFDLHTQIVNFIRRFYPQAIMTCTCGELQDNDKKRIESKMKGYLSGVSDIIIFNPNKSYNSLCLEFKSPSGKGVISDKQKKFMQDMKKNCKAKTIISDDYNYLVYEIIQYFNTVRICCNFCNGKFKTNKTLESHMKHFHRIQTV